MWLRPFRRLRYESVLLLHKYAHSRTGCREGKAADEEHVVPMPFACNEISVLFDCERKMLLTILSESKTYNDKKIERHPQQAVHLRPDAIGDDLLLELTHRRIIDAAAHLEGTEAPQSHRLVARDGGYHETAGGYHQGVHEQDTRSSHPRPLG